MPPRPEPTGRERILGDDELIVSKTDLKGILTYGNRNFIAYSGYEERELLGAPHNLIRHPDMPRAVFQLLWERIEAGQEVFAYVVNLSKDGGHYWVFANVMMSRDVDGRPIGYHSVRRKPKPATVKAVQGLYGRMQELETRIGGEEGMRQARQVLNQFCDEKGGSYDDVVLAI